MECRQLVLAVFQASTKRNLVTARHKNSRKNFLFKLVKHGSYENLTIGSYDVEVNHVTMAQKNNERN